MYKTNTKSQTGSDNSSRGVVSLPGSPRNSSSVPVVGSAESLVTRVGIIFGYPLPLDNNLKLG